MSMKQNENGMILVMVVLITSAILAVGLGIFSSVFNQLRTASETRYSFNALYAADRGIERTLYLDRVAGPLCPGVVIDGVPDVDCYKLGTPDDPVYPGGFPVGNNACVTVRVGKDIKCDNAAEAGFTRIRSTGLYQCGSGELGVKRAFCLSYQPAASSGASFTEVGGLVSGEAENSDINIPQGAHSWEETLDVSASGGKYMEAWPNSGTNNVLSSAYLSASPYMAYSINFTTTGTYYIWIRMNTPDNNGDTLHAGLDGVATPSAERIDNTGANSSWVWVSSKTGGGRPTIVIPAPGVYELYLWMQEDGNRIDQWLLTTDSLLVCPDGVNCL